MSRVTRAWHATSRDRAASILDQGLLGGWDGALRDPVLIEILTSCDAMEYVTPDPGWPCPQACNEVLWYPTGPDTDTPWRPQTRPQPVGLTSAERPLKPKRQGRTTMDIQYVGEDRAPVRHPFPTEPLIDTGPSCDGGVTERWYSPPVQVGKKCQRYVAQRRIGPDGSVKTDRWAESAWGWTSYVSRENWAASVWGNGNTQGYPKFRHDYQKRAAKALQMRWYGEMMSFLHSQNPATLKERLDDFNSFIGHEKSKANGRKDAQKTHEERFGRLEHGDLALTRTICNFAGFAPMRHFVMLNVGSSRKILKPHIWQEQTRQALVCRISRTDRMSFLKVGSAAFDEISEISGHERLRLLRLADEIRCLARADGLG